MTKFEYAVFPGAELHNSCIPNDFVFQNQSIWIEYPDHERMIEMRDIGFLTFGLGKYSRKIMSIYVPQFSLQEGASEVSATIRSGIQELYNELKDDRACVGENFNLIYNHLSPRNLKAILCNE